METLPYTVRPREDTGLFNAKVGIWLFLASEVMLFGALFSSYILLRVGADPGTWPHHLLDIPLGTLNTLVLICSSVTVVLSWAALKLNQFGRYRIYQGLTILCALIFLGIKSFEYRDKFTHYEIRFKDPATAEQVLKEVYGPEGVQTARKIQERVYGEFTSGGKLAEAPTDAIKLTGHIEGDPMFVNLKSLAAKNADHVMFVGDAPVGTHEYPKAVKIDTSKISYLSCYGPWHNTYLGIYFTLTGLHALHVLGGALVIFAIWGPLAKMWKTDPERYTNRVEISGLFWHFVDLVWIFLFPVLYLL